MIAHFGREVRSVCGHLVDDSADVSWRRVHGGRAHTWRWRSGWETATKTYDNNQVEQLAHQCRPFFFLPPLLPLFPYACELAEGNVNKMVHSSIMEGTSASSPLLLSWLTS